MDNELTSYVENGVKVTVCPQRARSNITPRKKFAMESIGAQERARHEREAAKTLPTGETKCRI